MQHRYLTTAGVVLCCGLLVAHAREQTWTHWAGDATHTGTAQRAPHDFDHVAWTAAPQAPAGELEEFVWRGGAVTADGRVFITARHYVDDGTGLWEHTANAVICYDGRDGTRHWSTPVDADSYEFDSWATPVIDRANDTVIVASHFSLFALDRTNGYLVWNCELPTVLVNASPTVSEGLTNAGVPANRVFITDYTGFGTTGGGIYAINTSPYDAIGNPYAPGDLVWQDQTLPGTSGNTVAYADGYVYLGTTHGGEIRAYAALDGGAPGLDALPAWTTDTGIEHVSQYAGFYGGVAVHDGYVYGAGYSFYGTGDNSRLYKLATSSGAVIWETPCERTDSIPIVADDGRIYLSAGIEGFGSAVKIQAFEDHGTTATMLWDTYNDSGGRLLVGGWTHQPLLANGRLYCGTPDDTQFFAPYVTLYALDLSYTPADVEFVHAYDATGGGSPATTGRYLYSLGTNGLVAYRGCGDGDLDADGDVDGADAAAWLTSVNGPDVITPPAGCDAATFECADIDWDNDVDLHDFATLQGNMQTDATP